MNAEVKAELLRRAKTDLDTRAALIESGELYGGYHPSMAAVHAENAHALNDIIQHAGWPGRILAGDDGAEAAWLILQHAIAFPDLQRSCLPLLEAAAESGDIPASYPAYVRDRICVFEERPQRYGTQFDWDDDGLMSPLPLQEPEHVDALRAEVGLEPLAVRTRQIRAETVNEPPPDNIGQWRQRKHEWAVSVGWIADAPPD